MLSVTMTQKSSSVILGMEEALNNQSRLQQYSNTRPPSTDTPLNEMQRSNLAISQPQPPCRLQSPAMTKNLYPASQGTGRSSTLTEHACPCLDKSRSIVGV